MRLLRAVLVLATLFFGLTAAASAQLFSDDEGNALSDFPQSCNATCSPFESTAISPSGSNPGEDETSEQSVLQCLCTDANAAAISSCAECILAATDDVSSSESANTVLQLAISFVRGCGIPVQIDGAPAAVSSALAEDVTAYAAERSSLALTQTTASGAGATTSAGGQTGASQTSQSGSPSETSSGSASTPKQDSSAPTTQRGFFAGVLIALGAGAAYLL
ncbi:hypothetical protein JCM10207_002845 [Rhodosporidiobolus poonsookiae]